MPGWGIDKNGRDSLAEEVGAPFTCGAPGWPATIPAMRTVVVSEPPAALTAWLDRRRALGQDVFDEVWEGAYHVAPAAWAAHGDLDDQLAALLRPLARSAGLWPSGPLNLGRPENYRVPDRAYLRTRAQAVFVPTAAVVVEVVSPRDDTYDKFSFYNSIGVDEVLVVDPDRRSLAWYARRDSQFERVGRSVLLGIDEAPLAAAIDWPPLAAA